MYLMEEHILKNLWLFTVSIYAAKNTSGGLSQLHLAKYLEEHVLHLQVMNLDVIGRKQKENSNAQILFL